MFSRRMKYVSARGPASRTLTISSASSGGDPLVGVHDQNPRAFDLVHRPVLLGRRAEVLPLEDPHARDRARDLESAVGREGVDEQGSRRRTRRPSRHSRMFVSSLKGGDEGGEPRTSQSTLTCTRSILRALPVASSTSITAPESRMSFLAVSKERGVWDRNFSMIRSFEKADDPLVGARHPRVRQVGRAARADRLVGRRDVGVRPDDGGHAAVQVPAQRLLFRGRLRVHVHEDDSGVLHLRERLVRHAKRRIRVGRHEHLALQVEDADRNARGGRLHGEAAPGLPGG